MAEQIRKVLETVSQLDDRCNSDDCARVEHGHFRLLETVIKQV